MKSVSILLGFLLGLLQLSAQNKLSLPSPDGTLHFLLDNDSSSLQRHNLVLAKLQMGIVVNGDTLTLDSATWSTLKLEEENKTFHEYYVQLKSRKAGLRLRLYNHALAYRYEGNNMEKVRINGELSSWHLPGKTVIWYFERKNPWKLKSYAGLWEECALERLAETVYSPVQGLPIVFRHPSGTYGFISEAALENYSGMRLKVDKQGLLTANFTEGQAGFEVMPVFHSPWRVMYFAENLDGLVNQPIIKSLSPFPDVSLYGDTSYIQPGKCAWRWFSKGTGSPQQEREMIDAAAALNFTYSMVDDGWKNWSDCWKQAQSLVDYGKTKNVKLFFWQHSRPLQNPSHDYLNMRTFLDSVEAIGAAGIKVDFMDSEAKLLIDFEIRLLKECAQRKLLVNFHGCHNPSGEAFTYPNEMTREGIRGLELNKMREGYIPAYHNAALPFTRFVVGHGDYTPLSFTVPGSTTWAHQLATLVCFDSPLQTIAEDPVLLLNEPRLQSAVDFVRNVPTVWEETRVLPPSEIRKMAVLARRSGKNWYIGVLNGEKESKEVVLDLSAFVYRRSDVQAYMDDVNSDKVLLPMDGHRQGVLKREPVVPFLRKKVKGKMFRFQVAPEGGAVIVINNDRRRKN